MSSIENRGLERGAGRPAGVPQHSFRKIGIVASGDVGTALAQACTVAAVPYVLTDAESVDVLGDCDLVIESIAGGRDGKARAMRAIEAVVPAGTVLCSDMGGLALETISLACAHPERLTGLRLQVPIERSRLVEVVQGRHTSDTAVATVFDFLLKIARVPILVSDSAGLIVERIQTRYTNEGMALLGEGVPAEVVEQAALAFGLRSGPLAMLDESGLEHADEMLHRELDALAHGHHDHEHDHAHGHGHGHAHDHPHEHGHAHDHGHSHDHEHACCGGHGHGQSQTHGHHHSHQHHHEHGHSCCHSHDHKNAHAPVHDHKHGECCGHAHEHGHGHSGHTHQQIEAQPLPHPKPAHRHTHKVKSRAMPDGAVYVLEKMAHGYRRLGRAHGAGFYDYADDGTSELWSGLKSFTRSARQVPAEEIRDRLAYVQALEALRCLQDGVIDDKEAANIASIVGLGFPEITGGAIDFVNSVGVDKFAARARELAAKHGERFEPPAVLDAHAATNTPF